MLNYFLFGILILLAINIAVGLSAFVRDVFEYHQPLKKFELKKSSEVYEEIKQKEIENKENEEKKKKESGKHDSIFN